MSGASIPNTPLEAALYYAQVYGWHVFPVADDTKVPHTPRGFLDATTDSAVIKGWWSLYPTARIGVAMRPSGLIAIDVDVGEGKVGDVTFAALEAKHGPLPRNNVQRSGSGGYHYVMRDPSPGDDGWTRNRERGGRCRGKVGENVDVKNNGYILVQPSGSYRWEALDPARLADVPLAWLPLLQHPDNGPVSGAIPAAVEKWAESVGTLTDDDVAALYKALANLGPRGNGKDTTYKAVRTVFHDYGLSVEAGAPYLIGWNNANGEPHSDRELERQVERIGNKPEPEEGDHDYRGPRGYALGLAGIRKLATNPTAWVNEIAAKLAVKAPMATTTSAEPAELDGYVYAAQKFVRHKYSHTDGVRLRRWRGGWYEWTAERGCYTEISDEQIERDIYRCGKSRRNEVVEVRQALIAIDDVFIDQTELGTWIGARDFADPRDVITCPNGLVHLPTGQLVPSTPRYFSTSALGANYAPDAPPPTAWLKFLSEVLPDDDGARDTLQEMFGYLLTADTRQHKIFMPRGGRRSGKGTATRVLERLLGGNTNVAHPTLSSLVPDFGREPLIGKTAAIIGDARLSGRTDAGALLEHLLSISGGDSQTIPRKYKGAWTGYLDVRFIIATNEIPKIHDPSGAFAGRVILIPFLESFYGREDVGLSDKLYTELPGILLWAIEGWRRLRQRGRFVQPASGEHELHLLEDLGDPVSGWMRECCEEGPEFWVPKAAARDSFKAWCSRTGKTAASAEEFGRDMLSKGYRDFKPKDPNTGKQVNSYRGLRLRPSS